MPLVRHSERFARPPVTPRRDTRAADLPQRAWSMSATPSGRFEILGCTVGRRGRGGADLDPSEFSSKSSVMPVPTRRLDMDNTATRQHVEWVYKQVSAYPLNSLPAVSTGTNA